MSDDQFTDDTRIALAADLLAARIAEQRRQDEQRMCEECRDVECDYDDELEGWICADCKLAIDEEIASGFTQEEEDRLNSPTRGQAESLNRKIG